MLTTKKMKLYRLILSSVLIALVVGSSSLSFGKAADAAIPPVEKLALVGLPDGYGYEVITPVETWEDANAGIRVNTGTWPDNCPDDKYWGPFPLGFNFRFYENTYNQFYVSVDGLVTFGAPSLSHTPQPLPFPPAPNNVVAPYWTDWREAYYKIFYRTVPGVLTVIEWEVFTDATWTSIKANYEVILYADGGDIVFQYANLSVVPDRAFTVGIEDASGINGLAYTSPLAVGQDLRFIRPLASRRVNVKPRLQGGLTANNEATYKLQVINNGELGADIYNLTALVGSPGWQATFHNGTTGALLTDTTADGIGDTGLLAMGASKSVLVRVTAPPGVEVGAHTAIQVNARSLSDSSKFITTEIQAAVPAQFTQVFEDTRGIHMAQVWQANYIDRTIAPHFPGSTASLERVAPTKYLVAWEVPPPVGAQAQAGEGVPRITIENYREYLDQPEILNAPQADGYTDIRYRLVSSVSGPGPELTLTTGAADVDNNPIYDSSARIPAIASSAVNGRMGVAYTLLKSRQVNGVFESNSSIRLAVLRPDGSLATELHNVTKDLGWYEWTTSGGTHQYEYPNVLITPSQEYVVCWSESFAPYLVRCAFHTYSGGVITDLETITVGEMPSTLFISQDLSLTSLTGDSFMAMYTESNGTTGAYQIVYSVWDHSQPTPQVKGRTALTGAQGWQPRAVRLDTGEVLMTWVQEDGRLGYAFLDQNYNLIPGYPQFFERVNKRNAGSPSITLDNVGRAVITFLDDSVGDSIFYALITPEHVVLTPPLNFISDRNGAPSFFTSNYGHGNSGYSGVSQVFMPVVRK